MKVNTKVRYGLRALVEIALPENSSGILQKDIAKNQDISEKYLDVIISSLKAAGLIMNLKGKKSGYTLTRQPEEITIYDVYRAFEMHINIVPCLLHGGVCDRTHNCASKGYWSKLNSTIVDHMNSVTINDIIKEQIKFGEGLKKTNLKN